MIDRSLTRRAARFLAGCAAALLIIFATATAQANDCDGCYVGDLPCSSCGDGCSSCGDGCNSCGDGCNSCGDGCNSCGDGCGHCGDDCHGCGCGSDYANGSCKGRAYGKPDLFYNYYTQGACNQANAQMYLSPLPVPPNVGHTFFTYQPFYPHHMLYWHKDRYHRYYDGGRGMNRTSAVYYGPPVRQAMSNIYWNMLRIPR